MMTFNNNDFKGAKIWMVGADGKLKEAKAVDESKYSGLGDLAPKTLQFNTADTRVYDGHFWVEKDGKIINDFTGKKVAENMEKEGRTAFYQRITHPEVEAFIAEAMDHCIGNWKTTYGTDDDAEAIEMWLENNSIHDRGGFGCVQNCAIQRHLNGGVVRYGNLGSISIKDDRIYWFFGHPRNEPRHWVNKGIDAEEQGSTDILAKEGRLDPTRYTLNREAKEWMKTFLKNKKQLPYVWVNENSSQGVARALGATKKKKGKKANPTQQGGVDAEVVRKAVEAGIFGKGAMVFDCSGNPL
jgi:hypothetical protein